MKVVIITTSPHLSTSSSLTLCGILHVTVCAIRPERARTVMIRGVFTDTKKGVREVLEECEVLAMIRQTVSVAVSSRTFWDCLTDGLAMIYTEQREGYFFGSSVVNWRVLISGN